MKLGQEMMEGGKWMKEVKREMRGLKQWNDEKSG